MSWSVVMTVLKSAGLGLAGLAGLTLAHSALSSTIIQGPDRQLLCLRYPTLMKHESLSDLMVELNEYRFYLNLDPFFELLENYLCLYHASRKRARKADKHEILKLPELFHAKKYQCEEWADDVQAALWARCPDFSAQIGEIIKNIKRNMDNLYILLDAEVDELFEQLDYC